jgi:hypothetical protein
MIKMQSMLLDVRFARLREKLAPVTFSDEAANFIALHPSIFHVDSMLQYAELEPHQPHFDRHIAGSKHGAPWQSSASLAVIVVVASVCTLVVLRISEDVRADVWTRVVLGAGMVEVKVFTPHPAAVQVDLPLQ